LQQEVNECDPDYYEQVDRKNPHRLIRALELFRGSGLKASQLRVKEKRTHDFRIIKIGLEVDREILYERIDTRMAIMIKNGLFEEAEHFYSKRKLNALQTVGYKEIFDYLEGKSDREEAIRLLKRNSRRYAKRQLTWFKRDSEMNWLRPDQVNDMIELIGN
jgi:tRNA dimethylallyltransferase